MIENKTSRRVPDSLLAALGRWDGRYSLAVALYDLVWVDSITAVGTFGDGSNGTYEWFVWEEACGDEAGNVRVSPNLKTSNSGYGDTVPALRDVLNEVCPRD
jgi:hypothetical protein